MGAAGRASDKMSRLEHFWFRSVDSRRYALLRAGFGTAVLISLLDQWSHRYELYTAGGIADNAAIQSGLSWLAWFSVFESPQAVNALFVCFALSAAALIVGFWSRASMLMVFVWLQASALQVAPAFTGWDALLRCVGFILLLSPLGESWSVDAWCLRRAGKEPSSYSPVYGLYLVQWQIAIMYWVTAFLKLGDSYWRSGEFASYFFMSMFSTIPSSEFASWAALSTTLTYASLATELSLPLLLWFRRSRVLGFLLGAALHLGIAATSILYVFSVATLALYPAFLDDKDLETIDRWIKKLARSNHS